MRPTWNRLTVYIPLARFFLHPPYRTAWSISAAQTAVCMPCI